MQPQGKMQILSFSILLLSLSFTISIPPYTSLLLPRQFFRMKYVTKWFLFSILYMYMFFTVTHIYGDLFPHLQIPHRSCQTPFTQQKTLSCLFSFGLYAHIFYISFISHLSAAYTTSNFQEMSFFYGNCFPSKRYCRLQFLAKLNRDKFYNN